MESCRDFIPWLGHDLSMKILTSLDDPSDIIRFGAVSTSWRDFAVENGLSKHLFLNQFPGLSNIPNNIIEGKSKRKIDSRRSRERNDLEKDQKVYAYLARGLANSTTRLCIYNALSASSTNNYPEESLQNTLEPRERVGSRASYWSSKSQMDPTVPEKITYILISNICVVTEIHVQPFQAESEFSKYSPRAMRFRMGYPKFQVEMDSYGKYKYDASRKYDDNAFSWTYISPELPMAHKFKLPEPVLCIGGILQIELFGRLQCQESDDLHYIRITHVEVVGRPLCLGFEVDIVDSSGRCKLNYYPGAKYRFRKKKVVNNRLFTHTRAFEVMGERAEFISSSISRSGLVIHIFVMAFICLHFLIKLSKLVPS